MRLALAAVLAALASGGAPAGPPASFHHLTAVHWWGHTRGLDVHRDGTGVETVDDGCCDFVYELRFHVFRVAGAPAAVVATYRVTRFRRGPGWPKQLHVPRVGTIGKLRLQHGVLTDLLMDSTFCAPAAPRCGA